MADAGPATLPLATIETLTDLAQRHGALAGGEPGLLYHKLARWSLAHAGRIPGPALVRTMADRLHIDLTRARTRTQRRGGQWRGSGAGVSLTSLDAASPTERSLLEQIPAAAEAPLEPELLAAMLDELRALHGRERAILIARLVERRTLEEVGREYELSASRVSVIERRALARIRAATTPAAADHQARALASHLLNRQIA